MTKLYKLTTQDNKTRPGSYNECIWGENVTHSGTGEGDLCGPGWIHAYTDPLLAVFLNPVHANIKNPKLWECTGEISKNDNGMKVGCKSLTTIKEVPVPEVSVWQRVAFGILCALGVCQDPTFVCWAKKWLDGTDRSLESANSVASSVADSALSASAAANAVSADSALASPYSAAFAAYSASVASTCSDINLTTIARKAMDF